MGRGLPGEGGHRVEPRSLYCLYTIKSWKGCTRWENSMGESSMEWAEAHPCPLAFVRLGRGPGMCMKRSLGNEAGTPYRNPCPSLGICTSSSLCLEHTFLPYHLFIRLIRVQSRSLQLEAFPPPQKKNTNLPIENCQSPPRAVERAR